MTFITLVSITLLCLLLPFARMYAVIGAAALLYFYPYLTLTLLGLLLLGGIAFHYFQRRKSHAL